MVGKGIYLAHCDDRSETSDLFIPIESALDEFRKLRDPLAEANADTESSEPSERPAIVTSLRESANEDPFSLPARLELAGRKVGMAIRIDSETSTRAESVQVRSILSLARVLEELCEREKEKEKEKEEGSEEEDDCEVGDEKDEAEMPVTPENYEISADLMSRMPTIRAQKESKDR
jgi:hypothetical protein